MQSRRAYARLNKEDLEHRGSIGDYRGVVMAARSKLVESANHQGFEFDYNHNVVFFNGKVIHLSPHEADILQVLLNNRARATPLDVLIQQVYGLEEPETAAVSIRVSIHSLRKKIQETGIKIRAEARVGYEVDATVVPDLNRRLSDIVLMALNMAKASNERDIVERLQLVYDIAEAKRRQWLSSKGLAGRGILAAEEAR
jgi:DNA-binding winged helix-turn-helix (wHTH) protein